MNKPIVTKEQLLLKAPDLVGNILLRRDLKERETLYTGMMNQARELGIEKQIREIAQQTARDYNEPEFGNFLSLLRKVFPCSRSLSAAYRLYLVNI